MTAANGSEEIVANAAGPHETGSGPEITIVMPVRDEEKTVEAALASVFAQEVDGTFEVVIAEGRSRDATRAILERLSDRDGRIRIVDNGHGGIPQGLNAALAAARGRYLVRLDGHARMGEGYVQRVVDHLRSGRCEGAGGRILAIGTTAFGRAVAAVHGSRFGIGNASHHYLERTQFIDHLSFGGYLTQRARAIGGWDERFARNEDFDFNFRYRRAGGRILFDPMIVGEWRVRETVRALARQYFGYGFWKLRTLVRHPSSLRLRWLVPPTLVVALVVEIALSFTPLARAALATTVLAYLAFLVTGGVSVRRQLRPRLVPAAMLALATMHLAWGVGFVASAAKLVVERVRDARRPSR